MGIHSGTGQRRIASIAAILAAFLSATVASAGTRLYTGTIQILVDYGYGYVYSNPLGAQFSYPKMNNLPTGDLATTTGYAPQGVRIGPNQMTLMTSLSTFSLPPSWNPTWLETVFSGHNDTGIFSVGGAPGPATSTPVTSAATSGFRVSFSGTPTQFGGTMRLLADFSVTSHFENGARFAAKLPLGAVGGNFGGKLTAMGSQGGGGTWYHITFFTDSVWGFPWTTGTVMATAPTNPTWGYLYPPARITAMGSDLRTPQGRGRLQLVTPFVVRKRSENGYLLGTGAGVAIASLHFVPEPSAIAQLAAGLSLLAAIYGFSRRKPAS